MDNFCELTEALRRLASVSLDWDESKHPRGNQKNAGQFAKKGTATSSSTNGGSSNSSSGRYSNRNVTPEQDAAYADAVKRGDKETALRMISEAAAKAMPNTKVVDHDGLPKVVYHASNQSFNEFDPSLIQYHRGAGSVSSAHLPGFYFSDNKRAVAPYGSNVGSFFVSIASPLTGYTEIQSLSREQKDKIADSLLSDVVVGNDGPYRFSHFENDGSCIKVSETDKNKLKDYYINNRNIDDWYLGLAFQKIAEFTEPASKDYWKEFNDCYSKYQRGEITKEKYDQQEQYLENLKEKEARDRAVKVNSRVVKAISNVTGADGVILADQIVAFRPSQIKSADATYDDAGNLIPLSKRFDPNSNDIRY